MELADAPNGLGPGWFMLQWDAGPIAGGGPSTLLLALDPEHATWVEYPLPMREDGPQRYVLRTTAAFYRAVLTSAEASARQARKPALARMPAARMVLLAAQRMPAEALRAGWWWLAGKKVRARNRLQRILAPLPCFDFRNWIAHTQRAWQQELPGIEARLAPGSRPHVTVCVAFGGSGAVATETEQSVQSQRYTNWTLVAVAGAPELNAVLNRTGAGWLVHVVNGERLEPDALLRIAAEIADRPDAALVYWDDSNWRGDGLIRTPRLKPDWNADLQWAQDYIGSAAVSCRQASAVGGADATAGRAAWFDLVVRIADAAGAQGVRHVPRILSHRPAETEETGDAQARRTSVERLAGTKAAPVSAALDSFGHVRVTWGLPDPAPLVTLVVPTRDRLDLLQPCIDGLLHRTDYPAIEVLVADNESRERETHAYFRSICGDERVRVVPCPGVFNFSAINNRAVGVARGSVIGFINNDIDVMQPDWLREMVGHALRPGIGAVGAKLLYPSGLVQHAGVVVGLNGLAGHAHRFYPAGHPGYMDRLQCAQFFSAVTAACLVLRRATFVEAGGFDEAAFPVAYNDVDLCLRLRQRGLENVWTPYAVLRHKETATRERDHSRARQALYLQESAAFRQRWGHVIAHDPHYNPHLTMTDESFLP